MLSILFFFLYYSIIQKVVLVQNGDGFFSDAWKWTKGAVSKGSKIVSQVLPVVKFASPFIKQAFPKTRKPLEAVGLGRKRGRGARLVGNGTKLAKSGSGTRLPHQIVRNGTRYKVTKVRR